MREKEYFENINKDSGNLTLLKTIEREYNSRDKPNIASKLFYDMHRQIRTSITEYEDENSPPEKLTPQEKKELKQLQKEVYRSNRMGPLAQGKHN